MKLEEVLNSGQYFKLNTKPIVAKVADGILEGHIINIDLDKMGFPQIVSLTKEEILSEDWVIIDKESYEKRFAEPIDICEIAGREMAEFAWEKYKRDHPEILKENFKEHTKSNRVKV